MAVQYTQLGIPGTSVANVNLDGQGNPAADPTKFDGMLTNLLNLTQAGWDRTKAGVQQLGTAAEENKLGISRAARYAPGGIVAAGQLAQGDVAGGLGAAGLTAIAGKMLPAMAGANPLVRGAVQVATSLGAGALGSQLGRGVAAAGNQLFGGAQAVAGNIASTVAGAQREAGQAAGTGTQPGVPTDQAMARQLEMLKQVGVNIPRQYLEQNYQILQKYKDAEAGRQMQLNQANAQLTGQLNQQIIAGQLASGAQSQAGATTRDILTSNPYAQSVLQTGGIRGI